MPVIILVLASFVLSIIGFGEVHASGNDAEEYLSLGSDIIVNLQGRKRYLRVKVDLMIEGEDHVEKVRTHIPALRHALIMIFSDYEPKQLATVEQREQVRQIALQASIGALEAYSTPDGLKDLYFSNFLVQ